MNIGWAPVIVSPAWKFNRGGMVTAATEDVFGPLYIERIGEAKVRHIGQRFVSTVVFLDVFRVRNISDRHKASPYGCS
jgi:hypothetical protein